MRLSAATGNHRSLWDARTNRRAGVVWALSLAERLITLAAAWSLLGSPLVVQLVASGSLALTLAVRGLTQVAFAARTQAELLDRVVRAVLLGDVSQSILIDDDAHAELGQALYNVSQHLIRERPMLFADAIAAVPIGLAIALHEPARQVAGLLALFMLAMALLAWSRARLRRRLDREWSLERQAYETMVDALEGRLEIVASGHREAFIASAARRATEWGDAGVRRALSMVLAGKLPLLGIGVLVLAMFVAGGRRAGLSLHGLADVALFASAVPAFFGIAQGVHAEAQSHRWLALTCHILQGSLPASGEDTDTPSHPTDIVFEHVSFRYPNTGAAELALGDVSFRLAGERIIALSGRNGSGKSTLLRLLLSLAKPTSGAIRVGDRLLSSLHADAWRARVAFLSQRPYLPPQATIATSIRLLAPQSSDQRLLAALERVQLLPALKRTGSDPLRTKVASLSVGQRQRVALARLLCMDQGWLVLLDEPDANLDNGGVSLLADVVRELARTRVVVLAVHSADLLGLAERVITLDEGRLIKDERGFGEGAVAAGVR